MKKKFGVSHGMAKCEDCEWTNENYKNAQATAAVHAKKHKHTVNVEIGICGYYYGNK